MIYDESYYRSENYVSYLDRAEKYVRTAKELQHLLERVKSNKEPYLDYGCAVGHLVYGFNQVGVSQIRGYDISQWAVEEGLRRGLAVSTTLDYSIEYGVTFFLDVLEHLEKRDLRSLFKNLKTEKFVFRIPVAAEIGGDYVLECSRNDPTHIIRWTKEQWNVFFDYYGFKVLPLDLSTIYDTEGVYCGLAV